MFKKAVFIVFAVMLTVFAAGMSYANDGLVVNPLVQTYINPGGLGDSLLYGYYNVRGNINLFNVVNTSSVDGAKVRVIFRNAKNSKECLDFSVCLSRGDVWTAFLLDNGTTAAVCPFDTDTITAPTIPSSCQTFKYDGAGGQTGVTADDCREGYFEVIGLSSIDNYDKNGSSSQNVIKTEGDCRDWLSTGIFVNNSVENVLMGNNTILSAATLATYSYNAVALADTSMTSVQLSAGVELRIPDAMDFGCAEADYIFMKSDLISPYDLISALGGETEVTVTFPTRLACHNTAVSTDMFGGDVDPQTSGIQYCTPINLTLWDDTEHRLDITDFSPSVGRCLPYEVNVIKLGGSDIWDSTVASIVSTGSFELGWIDIDLAAGTASHSSNWAIPTLNGLPAVGYTTQSFIGGAASYMIPTVYR